MVGGGGEQSLVVRVAAHHPVQDDDVGRVDGLRGRGDVDEAAGHPVAQAGSRRELLRVGVVGVDELQVRGALGPATEQLELDVADASADLEDGGAVDAAAADEVDDAGRGPVQTAFAVPGPRCRENLAPNMSSHPRGSQQPLMTGVWDTGTRGSPTTDDPPRLERRYVRGHHCLSNGRGASRGGTHVRPAEHPHHLG